MELIERFWQFLVVGIGVVVWLVRLEARANSNAQSILENKATTSEDLRRLEERLIRQRAEDMEMRRRDWDKLDGRIADMQHDIKQILKARG